MEQNIYTGFHAVEERVKRASEEQSDAQLRLYYSKPGPRVKKIISFAQKASIDCEETDDETLDKLVSTLPLQARDHRGVVLTVAGENPRAQNSVQLEQWLTTISEKSTVIVLDSVTDPHNVGAILRSCDQFGANLLIVPEKRSASNIAENDIIARTSAGASAWVPIAVVTNLVRSVQLLKEAGFWVYGADAGGSSLQKTTFASRTCIVMGSEGNGIAHLLTEQCDSVVSIPTCGKIDSLNVSVAAGVLLYERYRQNIGSLT